MNLNTQSRMIHPSRLGGGYVLPRLACHVFALIQGTKVVAFGKALAYVGVHRTGLGRGTARRRDWLSPFASTSTPRIRHRAIVA